MILLATFQVTSQSATKLLFEDTLTGNLNLWTGKGGGQHQGEIVSDPLDASNRVLSFTGLNVSGDIFTASPINITGFDQVVLSFDYLGLAQPGSVLGNLGGFVGISVSLNLDVAWIAGTEPTAVGGSRFPDGIELIDDDSWHSYTIDLTELIHSNNLVAIRLLIEDWLQAGGISGDAYFDNIRVFGRTDVLNMPPLASITEPQDGLTFLSPTSVNIEAVATDPDGTVTMVEFFQDNVKLGEDWTVPYSLVWSNVLAGRYTLTVTATDNQDATGHSSPVTFSAVAPTNRPPVVDPIALHRINEGQLFFYGIQATDPDLPAQSLAYSLDLVPLVDVRLNSVTGLLSWTPTEAQGPSTNVLTVRVTDNGTPPMTAAATFTVIVDEVNLPPVLAPIADRTVSSGETVTIQASATDPDIPSNKLAYSLVSPSPDSASIDPVTGVFNWIAENTSLTQGNHRFSVKVTDEGGLSDETSFTVTVPDVRALTVQFPSTDVAAMNAPRRFVQNFPVRTYGGEISVYARRVLFENALCYLLEGETCECVSASMGLSIDQQSTKALDVKLREVFQIDINMSNNGRCLARGAQLTLRLPDGLEIKGVESDKNIPWLQDTQAKTATFAIGIVYPGKDPITVRLLLSAQRSGVRELEFDTMGNNIGSNQYPFSISVNGVFLQMVQASTGQWNLEIFGVPESRIAIESSSVIGGDDQWKLLTEIQVNAAGDKITLPIALEGQQQYLRAVAQ